MAAQQAPQAQRIPPQTIRIKRRRNEDPVDALLLDTQPTPKRRVTDYIFRRIDSTGGITFPAPSATPAPSTPLPSSSTSISTTAPPQLTTREPTVAELQALTPRPISTRPGDERLNLSASELIARRLAHDNPLSSTTGTSNDKDKGLEVPLHPHGERTAPPTPRLGGLGGPGGARRFHLHRSASSDALARMAGGGVGKRGARERGVAVFVERKVKERRVEELLAAVETGEEKQDGQEQEQEPEQKRKLKKPGRGARVVPGTQALRKADDTIMVVDKEVPPQVQSIWDQMVQDEVAKEQEQSVPRLEPPRASPQPPLKYKPKAVPRLKDRQPTPTANTTAAEADTDAMDIDTHNSDSDEDYVIDTYIRFPHTPAATPITGVPSPTQDPTIGYLVISAEDQPIWSAYEEDYNDDRDPDREFDTDDEDSNAEDYYGADYPDEDLEHDDEFEVNPYKYRHGSDEEEWDADEVDEAAFSDGEGGDLTKPWGKLPWERGGGGGKTLDSDEDEDSDEPEDDR